MQLKSLGLSLATMMLVGGAAHATTVTVHNCTDRTIKARAFNPKDGVEIAAKSGRTLKVGESKALKCDGQGKHRCAVKLWRKKTMYWSAARTVKKGETLYVTSVSRKVKKNSVFYKTSASTNTTGCD